MSNVNTHFLSTVKLITTLCFLLSASSALSNTVISSGTIMIDLTQANEHQQWEATNDNVMGGISQGQLTFDGQSSRFWGEVSLDNNGGFSSINRAIGPLPFEVDRVAVRFIGDGRRYQLRLATWKSGNRITYKHEFTTIKGQRQEKVFDLNKFQAVFRGRLLSDAPELTAQDTKQVGLLIADKQPGPFALNLIQIQFKSSQKASEYNHP
ncbi:CIA30 family protein [Photobacterium sanguinicancri]|uniref:CIA30 family protein n=1 Tax=Photobacterium sanguinicancri TaxID=875932 RepID=A0AAW7Y5X5_9GAMM|nr:CIA30 family protein [Photobacterium sanguinicancri]MDO6544026.1 CIA30 family protein [Photobacterium sanguinicancri]